MRLKNNPKAKDAIKESSFCLDDIYGYRGSWKSSFSDNTPIYIEIGCGKGQFLLNMANLNPEISFLGIEQYDSVLFGAIKKCQQLLNDNLRFICTRAEYLADIFAPGEVDRIFLNFSDPWPKKRHAKRRLTSPVFLNIYKQILIPGGLIEIKTDNDNLYEFSLEQLEEHPDFTVLSHTNDLYSDSDLLQGNVPTEYEDKFHNAGQLIHKIIAKYL